jgi:hypothetical protein
MMSSSLYNVREPLAPQIRTIEVGRDLIVMPLKRARRFLQVEQSLYEIVHLRPVPSIPLLVGGSSACRPDN